MSKSPIKFPSSRSSSEDELPSHHSSEENVSSDDGMSNYSPPWSSEKEDLEKEDEEDKDEDDTNAKAKDDDDSDDSDSNFTSPPPKGARQAQSSLREDHIFRLSSFNSLV
jgi:hypothetical protein